jgi:replication factor C small subunit
MPTASHDALVAVLERVCEAEEAPYDADGVEYVAGYADGDVREAILAAQTTFEQEGEVTMSAAYEVLGEVAHQDQVREMLDAAEAGEFTDARKTLDDLLVDEGYEGGEVLEVVLEEARSRYDGDTLARVYELAGQVDFDMTEGSSDRVHLSHLLAELGREGGPQPA